MDKHEVRKLFPECVAFADACRDVFGNGVKLVYACENGRVIGKKPEIEADRVEKLSDMVIGPIIKTDRGGKRGR